jgi:hypothetical protein
LPVGKKGEIGEEQGLEKPKTLNGKPGREKWETLNEKTNIPKRKKKERKKKSKKEI